MYRSLLAASLSALALTAGAPAQDAPRFTLGAGYERADFDSAEFDTIVLRGGYDFTRYLGVEGQVNVGIGDDSITEGGVAGDVELDYIAGLFGVVRPWSSDQGNVFLRAGYSTTEAEASVAGLSFEADDDAWAYGVGGEWFFAGDNGVRVDYTRFDYDDGGESDVFGVSYVRRFGG
ncbi:porin family protein [Maricaulis sp.]|uniref:porin family protein n=1 Tax=Maricaulis sp. TaxID=1486257 RepID=UPI002612D570|nr:porin family protein [Maricaulis sp.]